MASLARSLARFAFALGLAAPGVARAEVPPRLSIAAAGACPSAEEIQNELQELLPDAQLSLSPDVVDSDVVVSDRGAGFTVKVRGQRRRFREPKRDCTERARHVAVFAVLVVDPLRVPSQAVNDAEEEPEPPEKPPQRPAPTPEPRATAPSHIDDSRVDLSLGPLAQVALKSDASSAAQAGGLGLRLRYGQRVGATLGVAGLLPTSLHFALADARATWIPMDLGLSLSHRVSSWEVELNAGVAAALLLVEGQALDATRQTSRLELGGRLGVQVRYWASEHAGVFGGMFGSWFPKPYSLQVENLGAVGETPPAWLGGSLGAVIRL